MRVTFVLLALTSLCIPQVSAATWYFLRWWAPSSAAQFQQFSVKMLVPPIPRAGVYYLWPGLQETTNSGVYQEVLDGRTGSWWIGSGWCCSNPSLPWGAGFSAQPGKTVSISMTRDATGPNWTSVKTMDTTVSSSFALAYKNFNQALLAIELYDVTWDFGPLVFTDIVMVMSTNATAWCTNPPQNYAGATRYTRTGVNVTVSAGVTTCRIAKIVLEGPA